ncbi:MAG: ferredoxin [Spirochaetes bacterium]|jgi:ferredoxin|nr:ferredoxin [Spirochaetota bacterium]
MKAKVDKDQCTGCELCVETCPEVFKMDGDLAVAYASPVPAGIEKSAKQAADDCPATAIIIE